MAGDPLDPFLRKLSHLNLAETARTAVLATVSSTRELDARRDFLVAGEPSPQILVLLEGMVARHKTLPDGQRQIVSFGIAGDFCNAQALVSPALDFGVSTLSACKLAVLPHRELRQVVEQYPTIALALWRESVAESAVEREWMLNLGRRPALDRMAHMLSEMAWRTENAGLSRDGSYHFPLTQMEIADALGLSTVHVNRTLQELRNRGIIRFNQGVLTIVRPDALKAMAGFDPRYLAAEPA